MTTEKIVDVFIDTAKKNNIRGNISTEFIKQTCSNNEMSLEELIGTLSLVALKYYQELSAEKDVTGIYGQRIVALERTLEQIKKSQNLSSYKVKNLNQRNGMPVAKKFNENKFKLCIESGATKNEIMQALAISESTYYRLLRAYKAKRQ